MKRPDSAWTAARQQPLPTCFFFLLDFRTGTFNHFHYLFIGTFRQLATGIMRAISVMLWTFVAVVVIVECWVFYSWPFGPAWKASPAKAKTAKRRRERAKATPTHTPEPVPCVDAEKPECEQDELCTWCHSTHMPSACYSKDMAIGLPSPMFACGVELPTASTKRTKANKRARQGAIKRGESSHKVNPLLRQLPDPQEADASATWDYKRRPQTGPLQVCAW